MNDQSQIMNQAPSKMMSQMMSQPPPAQIQMMAQSQALSQSQQPQMMMMNRSYNNKVWPQQVASMDHPKKKFQGSGSVKPNYATAPLKPGRGNWKGKKVPDKRNDLRRMEKPMSMSMSMPMTMTGPIPNTSGISGPSSSGGYKPPTLHELQSQNRLKARKFYSKKKFNVNRFAPYAPRNTTSFIIRAKKAGGIAELVSPCPVTPAVLPTPIFSPSREVLGDMAKEEWGVDGYGSMKGLIRLRSPGGNEHDDEEEDENGGSSESDVEEHVEVERRLDHDLSRFEMIYPNYSGVEYNNVLENRVDDQDSHIAQLEEENLTLKERLFLMERELGDLRRRLQFLERQNHIVEDVNEEVVENGSENDSEGGSDAQAMMGCEINSEMAEYVSRRRNIDNENNGASDNEGVGDVTMEELDQRKELPPEQVVAQKKEHKDEIVGKENEVKVEQMRADFVRYQVKDDVKNEEARNEFVLGGEAIATEHEVKVELASNEFVADEELETEKSGRVHDVEAAEKDHSRNEELGNVCSEKSIGDGD